MDDTALITHNTVYINEHCHLDLQQKDGELVLHITGNTTTCHLALGKGASAKILPLLKRAAIHIDNGRPASFTIEPAHN